MKNLLGVIAAFGALHVGAEEKSSVDCESLMVCRAPPFTLEPYEVPALGFSTTFTAEIAVNADVWWTVDCPDDPDATFFDSGEVPAGSWYQGADIGEQPKGTQYSIQWTITGCPTLDCVNGTIGSEPDVCP
jgi:hypothetical protein